MFVSSQGITFQKTRLFNNTTLRNLCITHSYFVGPLRIIPESENRVIHLTQLSRCLPMFLPEVSHIYQYFLSFILSVCLSAHVHAPCIHTITKVVIKVIISLFSGLLSLSLDIVSYCHTLISGITKIVCNTY
jgi:hypothetical protein